MVTTQAEIQTPQPELSPPLSAVRPSIVNSSKWVFAGTFLAKPIQLITNVFLARLLGPASFGVLGLATSMAVTLSLIAGLGLGDASYKYVAEYYSRDRSQGTRLASVIVWSATLFSSALFLVLWLLSALGPGECDRSLFMSRLAKSDVCDFGWYLHRLAKVS
jgi:O-antigen/teichoic acid export membrane protein